MRKRQELLDITLLGLGLPLAYFILLPLIVSVGNAEDIKISRATILKLGLVCSAFLSALLFLFFYVTSKHKLPMRFFQIVLVTLFVLILFPANSGEITGFGQRPTFAELIFNLLKPAAVFVFVAIAAAMSAKLLSSASFVISILVMLCSLGFYIAMPSKISKMEVEGDKRSLAVLGRKSNIIVVLLDTFTGHRAKEIFEQSPQLASQFEGFTLYPNAIAPALNTAAGNSVILTGGLDLAVEEEDWETRNTNSLDSSFVTDAQRQGYVTSYISTLNVDSDTVNAWSELTFYDENHNPGSEYYGLLQVSGFRIFPAPVVMKVFRYLEKIYSLTNKSERSDQEILNALIPPDKYIMQSKLALRYFIDNMSVSTGDEDKRLIYFLSKVSHPKWNFSENGDWVWNAGWKSTSIYSLKLMTELFQKLKQLGVYDSSLVVIASDHGGIPVVDKSMGGAFESGKELHPIYNPLILVKPPGSTSQLRSSAMTVWLGDIAATVRDALSMESASVVTQWPRTRSLLREDVVDREIDVPLFKRVGDLGTHSRLKEWDRVDGAGTFSDYGEIAEQLSVRKTD